MLRTVGFDIVDAESEQPHRRVHTPSILGMIRTEKLFLQMHERACDLDQTLEKQVVVVAVLKPEVLQDIVGLVILLPVETDEITLIARIQRERRICVEARNKLRNTVAFSSRGLERETILRGSVRDKLKRRKVANCMTDTRPGKSLASNVPMPAFNPSLGEH